MKTFSNIKRIFTFGCSFTRYHWPTWADILAKEHPAALFFNFGHCGGGNLSIAARLTEANQRFKFNESDLVAIMWTTMCREDRYITWRDGWQMTGNIFTQNEYDKDFVEKYADTRGYLIRDLALIAMGTTLVKSTNCQHLILPSVPFNYQQDEKDSSIPEILNLYKDVLEPMPKSLLELEMNFNFTCGHTYSHPQVKEPYGDYHPDTIRYRNYLEKVGVALTEQSEAFAYESVEKLKKCVTLSDIDKTFNLMKPLEKILL